MLTRLARTCTRHQWAVLAAWMALVLAGLGSAPGLFSSLSSEVGYVPGSESTRADDLLYEGAPTGPTIYAVVDGRAADDPALAASLSRVRREVAAVPGVLSVLDPLAAEARSAAVATDGHAVALKVSFAPTDEGWQAVDRAAELLHTVDAPRVIVGGGPLQDHEMNTQAAADVSRAELITLPVVLVLLVLVFGGFAAAGLPVLVALVGCAVTLLSLALMSFLTAVSVYSVNVVSMLGLGLAVDYALLLVSRFREERAVDPSVGGAIERTMAAAGRTVLFSGVTVGISLGGLLVFPDTFLRSMGLAGMSVVLLNLAASLTLVPALLALVGHRIAPSRRESSRQGRVFVRVARGVRRQPVLVLVLVSAALLTSAAPFMSARFENPDASSLPASSASRQLADLAAQRFREHDDVAPVTVVLRGDVAAGALQAYADVLAALPGAGSVGVRSAGDGIKVVDVVPSGTSQDAVAQQLVHDVRTLPAPAPRLVTGNAAHLVDYQSMVATHVPWALGFVILVTLVLLFLFTGSVVIPVKALLTNMLSLGASFGSLVWVFQDGHLGGLVGTQALGGLSTTTPVLLAAIAFGLSMDYQVFLLGRITEEHRRSGDTDLAVERGLQHTGRIITAAAALMIVVFAGFVTGGFSPVKQIGLGLVVAVVVDATLVRMLLVPAAMTLLGSRNWWAPALLRHLHDRIGLHSEPEPVVIPECLPYPT